MYQAHNSHSSTRTMPSAPVLASIPHVCISACSCQDPRCRLRLSPEVSRQDCHLSRAEDTCCRSPAEHPAQRCPNSGQAKGLTSNSIDPPETVSCEVYEKCIFSPLYSAPVTALTRRDDPRAQVIVGSSTARGKQTCGSPTTCSGYAARINLALQPVGLIAWDAWRDAQLRTSLASKLGSPTLPVLWQVPS